MTAMKTSTKQYDYEKIVEIYSSGLSMDETALKIGCCLTTVRTALARAGIPVPRRKKLNVVKIRSEADRLKKAGLTQARIAEKLGVSRSTISKIFGLRKPGRRYDHDKILEMVGRGEKYSAIAQKIGCCLETVRKIAYNAGAKKRTRPDGAKKRLCRVCGKDAYPNYFYCKECHAAVISGENPPMPFESYAENLAFYCDCLHGKRDSGARGANLGGLKTF